MRKLLLPAGLVLFLILAALLDWHWYQRSMARPAPWPCFHTHTHHAGYVEWRKTESGMPYKVYFPPYDTPDPGCSAKPF